MNIIDNPHAYIILAGCAAIFIIALVSLLRGTIVNMQWRRYDKMQARKKAAETRKLWNMLEKV